MNLTFRPRLTRGSHLRNSDGTGDFCLVEAVGYNADQTVTDHHPSIDTVLAALGRALNDRMCNHDDDRTNICQDVVEDGKVISLGCQARLWAIGERIAGTRNPEISDDSPERAALHVHLAIIAASAALKAITDSELHTLAEAALEIAQICADQPNGDNLRIAYAAADAVDAEAFPLANSSQSWAGYAAAQAARAAAKYAAGVVSGAEGPGAFATVAPAAVDVVTYAVGAFEGEPGSAMGLARRVCNEYWKAKREADARAAGFIEADTPTVPCGNGTSQAERVEHAMRLERAIAAAPSWAECEEFYNAAAAPGVGPSEQANRAIAMRAEAAAAADADRVDAGFAVTVHPDDAGAAAAEAAEPQHAEAAYREAYADAAAAAELEAIKAEADDEYAAAAEENEHVNDFDESELGDVADEAIGDLQRAESMLNAIANEHRAVQSWWRKNEAGIPTEYRQNCCVSCRDATGQPVPAPCRTMQIIDSYGES